MEEYIDFANYTGPKNKNNKEIKGFITNKVSKELCEKYYKLHKGRLTNYVKFFSSQIVNENNFSIKGMLVMIIFSITFYLLLINIIITNDNVSKILIIFIYILGSIYQIVLVPYPRLYRSKKEFENNLSKLLDCKIIVTILDQYNDANTIIYPGNYLYDITGVINIPKSVRYIQIGDIQYYFDSNFVNFVNMLETLNRSRDINISVEYDDIPLNYTNNIYNLNANCDGSSVNIIDTLFCILLLEWILALFRCFSPYIVTIYPAKLILNKNKYESNTKITVHGKTFKSKDFIKLNIDASNVNKLKNEYNEYMNKLEQKKRKNERREKELYIKKKKEEEEQRKKKEEKERILKENTETLSRIKNNNFTIEVERVYDEVKLFLRVYEKKMFRKEIKLGLYDPEIEEELEDDGNIIVLYPRGYDIKIQVIYQEYKYIIKIGTIFSQAFNYEDKY